MLSAPTRRTQSPHCDGNAPWRFSAPACSPRVPSFLFLCSLPHLGRRTPAPVAHCMMIMCMSLRRPLVRPPSQPDRTGVYCSATQHTASPGVQQPGTSSPSAYKARWQLIATVFAPSWRRAVLAPCWIYRATLPLTSGHGSERTILWLIIYPQMNLEQIRGAGGTAAPVYSQGELPPLASKTVT